MEDVLQQISIQKPTASFAMPLAREELTQAMLEFLVWVEQNKNLTLCQPFKPQYDWYMPTFANKERLVREFLGRPRSIDLD